MPAALFFLLLFTIPRSPRWLVEQGRTAGGASTVLQMTGEKNYGAELQEIVESVHVEQHRSAEKLFSRKYGLPIFLAVSIGMFNQLSGINAILYYLNDIFGHAGFSKISGNLQAVAVGATNLIFTMLAMTVIDKIGAEVAAICDIDENVIGQLVPMEKRNLPKPKVYIDYRKLLEDKSIDAVSIATPNHWHSGA